MFVLNDDLSIYATRGDIVFFTVTADDNGAAYVFQPGDVVRIKVYGKKDAESVVLQKDFPVTAAAESVEIYLSEEDTKIGEVISKPKDYWYEVELNPLSNPQTIIGYDEDGAKVFKLFPEGDDIPEYVPSPEELPKAIDDELDLTSPRPVENQAIARAVVQLDREIADTKANLKEQGNTLSGRINALDSEVSVERARIDNLVASPTPGDSELVDIRVGADGVTYGSAGTAVREQFDSVYNEIGKYVHSSANLFNKEHTVDGKYLDVANDAEVIYTNADYCYLTDYIPIEHFKPLYWTEGYSPLFVNMYNAQKGFHYRHQLGNSDQGFTFTNTDAVYIRVSIKRSAKEDFMLTWGKQLPFEPFGKYMRDDVTIPMLVEHTETLKEHEKNLDELQPDYDAAGNFDSNILAYEGLNLESFYGDATKLCGCVTPNDSTCVITSSRQLNANGVGSLAFVDFSRNTIGIGKQQYPLTESFERVNSENLSFAPTMGHPYFTTDIMVGNTQTFTVTDGYTLESHTIVYEHENSRNRTGYMIVSVFGNGVRYTDRHKAYLLQPKKPKVLFIGDSFMNGWFGTRYASLIKRDLKGNAWIEGKTGETSTGILSHLKNTLLKYVEPQFIFWAAGTNDKDYGTWLANTQEFIAVCEKIGATPVLSTITVRADSNSEAHNAMALAANEWIRNSGYKYADLNIITTENYDGKTQSASMFLDDGVHPTTACFEAMYKKIKIDVPEIFDK